MSRQNPGATMGFDPASVGVFELRGYSYNDQTAEATLRYALGPHVFHEILTFEQAPGRLADEQRHALDSCLKYLHMAAGVSYYKAAVPPRITAAEYDVSAAEAAFFERFYLHGLGEFAYENRLDLAERIRFPVTATGEAAAHDLALPPCAAVPVGGGKDSIVTVDALRRSGRAVKLIAVGDARVGEATAELAGLPLIRIRRRLSRELIKLNAEGALNGHVPITGILSFVFAAAAVIYGMDTVVMSNERSANVGNLVLGSGFEVNHQYSKSLDFERRFADFMGAHALRRLRYFSLLRPFSELAIARRFARLKEYHAAFTSCNSNFRLSGGPRESRWCMECPKCRFVFLILAPFLSKSELAGIFGANLLDDATQIDGFRALLGIGDHKPFECVGEIEESRAALAMLAGQPAWRDDAVLRDLAADGALSGADLAETLTRVLEPSGDHCIPPDYAEIADRVGRSG